MMNERLEASSRRLVTSFGYSAERLVEADDVLIDVTVRYRVEFVTGLRDIAKLDFIALHPSQDVNSCSEVRANLFDS